MGGHQIDQNRGGSLFWSIYVSLVCPRLKSGRGSSKHSGSLLWSIWVNRGPPPPLLIPILVNLVPPPHHWALLWSIYCLPPSLIPIMVNLSSIGGCGVIIQHYSPYIAPIMVNYHHLGALMSLYTSVIHNIANLSSLGDFDSNILWNNPSNPKGGYLGRKVVGLWTIFWAVATPVPTVYPSIARAWNSNSSSQMRSTG